MTVRAVARWWHRFKRNLLDSGLLDVVERGLFIATGPWVHSSDMAVFVIALGFSVGRSWWRVVVFVFGFGDFGVRSGWRNGIRWVTGNQSEMAKRCFYVWGSVCVCPTRLMIVRGRRCPRVGGSGAERVICCAFCFSECRMIYGQPRGDYLGVCVYSCSSERWVRINGACLWVQSVF